MSRTVEFVVILEDGVRKRHRHQSVKGRVASFLVQLEVCVGGEWKPVVRYDSAHGVAHRDQFDREGNRTKTLLDLTFGSALTYGEWDINQNWQRYARSFLKKGAKP